MNKRWFPGRCGLIMLLLLTGVWSILFGLGRTVGSAGPVPGLPDLTRANWLLLGPLPNPVDSRNECLGFMRDYLRAMGGEAAAQPRPGMKLGRLKWQAARAAGAGLSLQNVFGPVEQSVAYAYTEFQAVRPQQAALKLGSDDGVKVWLNGRLVWENHVHRSLEGDSDAVPVHLQTGTNRLLLKIDQGSGEWGFSAGFRSLALEQSDWSKIRQPEYRFVASRNFISGNTFTGRVVTVPAYAVTDAVRVGLYDGSGKLLAVYPAQSGVLLTIPLPKGYSGECRIRISGTGSRAGISSAPASVFVGALQAMKREMAAKARRLAGTLAATNNRAADPKATLIFLANQLEGKVHASLCTTERTLRAMSAIHDIEYRLSELAARSRGGQPKVRDGGRRSSDWPGDAWPCNALTGIRQWAYRSPLDASYQPYSLYLPPGYNPSRKYRLLVCLHGYSGDDYSAVNQALSGVKPDDFIVAAPFGRGDLAYRALGEADVLAVIDLVQRSYRIDPDRVYLTGSSMGGCGAWRIGQFYADRFAAVAPFCGWTSPDYLENLCNTPVLIVHGDSDPTVPVIMDQTAYNRLRDLGYQVRYDELPGVGHDAWGAWTKVQGAGRFYEYLRRFSRNPWPERVVAAASHLRYGKKFWLRITELAQPLTKGAVDAAILDPRHLRVATANVKSFSLNLRHPKLAQSGRVLLEIDGYGLAVDAGQESCLLKLNQKEQRFACQRKIGSRARLESAVVRHDGGGLADLFTAPLLIVYDSRENAAVSQKAARILADWSVSRFFAGTKVGKFRVKADREVRDADWRNNNLLIIGSDRTVSRLIPEWYRKTPLDFYYRSIQIGKRRFERAGLMMVHPNPRAPSRLLGLISLPFGEQTYLDFITRLQLRMRAYGLENDDTASFMTPDVMIFDSPAKLEWAGCFDSNWRNLRQIDYN